VNPAALLSNWCWVRYLGLTRPGPDADRSLCALLRIKARDVYLCLPTRLHGLEINRRDSIASYLDSENKQRLFPRTALSVDQLRICFLWGRNWIFILMGLISRCKTVPWLRRLVGGLSPGWSRFDPSPVHVRFVVDKVALAFLCQYHPPNTPFTPSFLILLLWEGQAGDVWEPSIQFPRARPGRNPLHSSAINNANLSHWPPHYQFLRKTSDFYRFPNIWHV
jgi:hypothetical protein